MDEKSNTILIDSNIVIYSAEPEYEGLAHWMKNKNIGVSEITRIEVLGYNDLLLEDRLYFETFFFKSKIFTISKRIIDKAIYLKQQKKMSLGDSIIAATAITNQIPLVTANTNDFIILTI